MRYRKLDSDTLIIYFSKRDMEKYHINFSLFMNANKEKEAQDELCRLIKLVDKEGDFSKEGQLSVQMLPTKENSGIVLKVRKFDLDEDIQNPEELLQELLGNLSQKEAQEKMMSEVKEILSVVEELIKEEEEEERRFYENWRPALQLSSPNLNDLAKVAKMNGPWHMFRQTLTYSNGRYRLLSYYKKGIDRDEVYDDILLMNEQCTPTLFETTKEIPDISKELELNKGRKDGVFQILNQYF